MKTNQKRKRAPSPDFQRHTTGVPPRSVLFFGQNVPPLLHCGPLAQAAILAQRPPGLVFGGGSANDSPAIMRSSLGETQFREVNFFKI